jgi:hypothetical protein
MLERPEARERGRERERERGREGESMWEGGREQYILKQL